MSPTPCRFLSTRKTRELGFREALSYPPFARLAGYRIQGLDLDKVKMVAGQSVVQLFDPPLPQSTGTTGVVSLTPPTSVPVTTGISDDTNVEILSGLTLGEQIVVNSKVSGAKITPITTGATAGGAGRTGGGNAGFGGGGTAAIRL